MLTGKFENNDERWQKMKILDKKSIFYVNEIYCVLFYHFRLGKKLAGFILFLSSGFDERKTLDTVCLAKSLKCEERVY